MVTYNPMFKSKSVLTQILFEEKSAYENWNKLSAARIRASFHQLKWARSEENACLSHFFGALAELRWLLNEITKCAAEKQLEFTKVFKNIYHDERVLEEAKKALEACKAKIVKLQKQLDTGKKRQEQIVSIELELGMQLTLCQHIETSIKEKTKKLELYKVEMVKKGAVQQAEALLAMSEQLYSVSVAQTQLTDLLPLEPFTVSELHASAIERQMESVVHDVSEVLGLEPPKYGGINVKKFVPSVDSYDDLQHDQSSNLGSKAHSLEFLFSNSTTLNRGSSEDIRKVKRISFPLPLVPKEADSMAGAPIKIRPVSVCADSHAVVLRDKPFKSRCSSSSEKKHLSVISIEEHNEATILEDACFDVGEGTSPKEFGDIERLGSGSCESTGGDYADPIDALHDYMTGKDKAEEPPYATLEDIRKLRDIQIAAGAGTEDHSDRRGDPGYACIHEVAQSNSEEESPYSRPFDCLDSNAEPVVVSSRGSHRHAHRCMSPLTLRRVLSPTGEREELMHPTKTPGAEQLLMHQDLYGLRKRQNPTTFSDESRSPTPSDEGLDHHCHSTDGDLNIARPLSLLTSSNVSSSQPELTSGERDKEEEKEPEEDKWPAPQNTEGPMQRLKSFLRHRAGSDGHLASRLKHIKAGGKAKLADKDTIDPQVHDTAEK